MRVYTAIGIGPSGDLAETATILGSVLGLNFIRDQDSRYDEFPAFIADHDGIRYALLGTPDPEDDLRDEPTNDFQLMVTAIRPNHEEDEVDISDDLIAKISHDGRIECWQLN